MVTGMASHVLESQAEREEFRLQAKTHSVDYVGAKQFAEKAAAQGESDADDSEIDEMPFLAA